MKKIILALAFFCILVPDTFAQTIVSPSTFATYYGFRNGNIDFDNRYTWDLDDEDNEVFGSFDIESEQGIIDSAKEWFLAMACGTSQIRVTDVSMANRIEAILPSNDRRRRGLQAGFVVYQDIVIARFLGNTNMLSNSATMLKFICDNNGVREAEVETYYRNNIRALVSQVVDEEFNKVSFRLANSDTHSSLSHTAVLTHNPRTGQLTLSYGGAYTNDETREIKDMPTINALLAEMSRRTQDFDQTGINQVRAQAALIPAVALSDTALADIKNYLTAFYTTPDASTYACVRETDIVLSSALLSTGNIKYREVGPAYERALRTLNQGLAQKVLADVRASGAITTLTRQQQQRLLQLR